MNMNNGRVKYSQFRWINTKQPVYRHDMERSYDAFLYDVLVGTKQRFFLDIFSNMRVQR